ncbi:MAG: metal-dependent hydrolase [Candidatus Hodarchaeota archaeon]
MNNITHFLIGILIGTIFFTQNLFSLENIIIILVFSNLLDLDHLIKYNSRSKSHLRSFIQEHLAILMIGVPVGLALGFYLGFNYFWAVISLYSAHIIADYLCIFETYPLDPFNTKIVKEEGEGLVIPLSIYWKKRKAEFSGKLDEKYILICLVLMACFVLYIILIY